MMRFRRFLAQHPTTASGLLRSAARRAGRSPLLVRVSAAVTVAAALALGAFAAGVQAVSRPAPPLPAGRAVLPAMDGHWVDTWVAAPQLTEPGNMPPAPFTQGNLVFSDSTIRQTLRVTIGGQQIRLRFSNAYGGADLPITAVSVALPAGGQAGASAIQAGTSQAVTFDGNPGVDIPVGAQAVSDPLNFPVTAGSNLTVTMYLATGQASGNITSHPGSRTTIFMVNGNHLNDADLATLPGVQSVAHWYFMSAAEVWAKPSAAGVAVVGDSLTDGRGSITNGNDKWTDDLFNRMNASPGMPGISVLDQGLGGNRVLNDGLGPNALARLDRDVLAQSGVKWMIIWEGVNDIGTADATPAAQKQVADQLIAAYQQIVTRAHAMGIPVYGATITPFGGNAMYDDPAGLRNDVTRQTVNDWIRSSHQFDAVLDFDKVVRDPANPRQINPIYNSGDGLHLNPAGYQAIADSIPLSLFRPTTQPGTFGFR